MADLWRFRKKEKQVEKMCPRGQGVEEKKNDEKIETRKRE